MYAIINNRNSIYQIIAQVFRHLSIKPKIAELGVHNGTNALTLMKTLDPEIGFFIDSWDSETLLKGYSPFEVLPDWVKPIEDAEAYFGGNLREQKTFDRLKKEAEDKLINYENAIVLKEDTINGYRKLKSLGICFEYIYLDANHQYEFVLRELMEFSSILSRECFLQLNDCVFSDEGMKQNLGVIRALHEFMIRNPEFEILAQSSGNWADVIIGRKNTISIKVFHEVIKKSNLQYIEIPQELVFNSRFKNGRMSYCF